MRDRVLGMFDNGGKCRRRRSHAVHQMHNQGQLVTYAPTAQAFQSVRRPIRPVEITICPSLMCILCQPAPTFIVQVSERIQDMLPYGQGWKERVRLITNNEVEVCSCERRSQYGNQRKRCRSNNADCRFAPRISKQNGAVYLTKNQLQICP